ncbi:MAG: hypothetical protein GC151_17310 [Betaproteobacteria bacterium]|nr:hypothetical protein [Betaproteobacteria bacterium]
MRINAPAPAVVTVPDSTAIAGVDSVRPAGTATDESAGRRPPERPPAPGTQFPPPDAQAGVAAIEDRRGRGTRRRADRRTRQIPVLIDTRSGRDRRAAARRTADEATATPSVDIEA